MPEIEAIYLAQMDPKNLRYREEIIERGGKIVSIVPEYGPQASKSDYWIPVRAGLSDTAIGFIVIGCIIGVLLIIGAAGGGYWYYRRRAGYEQIGDNSF